MAKIKFSDGQKIAELLDNSWPLSGYLLNFSDASFLQFFSSELNFDIGDAKYCIHGTSKGKRLRAFFELEEDRLVGKCIISLAEYCLTNYNETNQELAAVVKEIGQKLMGNSLIDNVESLISRVDEVISDRVLIISILTDVKAGNESAILDRLHTFLHKYFAALLTRLDLQYSNDDKLERKYAILRESIMGNNQNLTKMTIAILKAQTNIIQEFNTVRNNNTLAHPNETLSREESIYIINQIVNFVEFIDNFLPRNRV